MRHFFGDLRADLLSDRLFSAIESLYHTLSADALMCNQTHSGVLKEGLGGLVMAGEPKCLCLMDSGNLGIMQGLS